MMTDKEEITKLLIDFSQGNEAAADQLYPLIYDHLRDIARIQLRKEHGEITLSQTDLVHESFLKMIDQNSIQWNDRNHFYAIAARGMRQFLVDHARKKLADKRGGGAPHLTLDEKEINVSQQAEQLIDLNDAIDELQELNDRLSRIVVMRFFGGLAMDEIAQSFNLSRSTVQRDWIKARAWLYNRLSQMNEERQKESGSE